MVIEQASHRNLIFVSFSQFGAAFSFNFIGIFMLFYIFNMSPYCFQETLLWVGAIIATSVLTFSSLEVVYLLIGPSAFSPCWDSGSSLRNLRINDDQ